MNTANSGQNSAGRAAGCFPVSIPSLAMLQDHAVEGRPVLPAVEALQLLAAGVRHLHPTIELFQCNEAEFLRFLETAPALPTRACWVEVEPLTPTQVRATLLSRGPTGPRGLLRSVVHVRAVFGRGDPAVTDPGAPSVLPLTASADHGLPTASCYLLDAARLYAELVPFGPAFHNVLGTIRLSDRTAAAELCAPAEPDPAFSRWLGSPFPLDAALHLACAWGQRVLGRILYPTGFARRQLFRPIPPGTRCQGLVEVRTVAPDQRLAHFDLCLTALNGARLETMTGLRMQELFREGRQPPDWIRATIKAES